jgi:CheY-like chemotaxis protein
MEVEDTLPNLHGARVLVVQNDPFVAADLDLLIDEAGGTIVALTHSERDALFLLGREPVDAAIVDPNLAEGEAATVMWALESREIPFVIYSPKATGHDVSAYVSKAAWPFIAALGIALELAAEIAEPFQFLLQSPPSDGTSGSMFLHIQVTRVESNGLGVVRDRLLRSGPVRLEA